MRVGVLHGILLAGVLVRYAETETEVVRAQIRQIVI